MHHVAQKSTSTTLPERLLEENRLPSSVSKSNAGIGRRPTAAEDGSSVALSAIAKSVAPMQSIIPMGGWMGVNLRQTIPMKFSFEHRLFGRRHIPHRGI